MLPMSAAEKPSPLDVGAACLFCVLFMPPLKFMDLYLFIPALVLKLLVLDFGGKLPEVKLTLGPPMLSIRVMPNRTFGGILAAVIAYLAHPLLVLRSL